MATHTIPMIRIFYGDTSWFLPVALIVLVIAGVLWLMARRRDAQDKRARRDAESQGHDTGGFQQDHGAQSRPGSASHSPQSAAGVPDARGLAWAQLHDPNTTPERLALIAAEYPEFARQIAVHPNVYPQLLVWARQTEQGERS